MKTNIPIKLKLPRAIKYDGITYEKVLIMYYGAIPGAPLAVILLSSSELESEDLFVTSYTKVVANELTAIINVGNPKVAGVLPFLTNRGVIGNLVDPAVGGDVTKKKYNLGSGITNVILRQKAE